MTTMLLLVEEMETKEYALFYNEKWNWEDAPLAQ